MNSNIKHLYRCVLINKFQYKEISKYKYVYFDSVYGKNWEISGTLNKILFDSWV